MIYKRAIRDLLPLPAAGWAIYKVLVRDESSYLHQTGWIKSLRMKQPVGLDGSRIPWMNYSVVQFLRERLDKSMELFEFGSGYSTHFYANLVAHVTSVENSEQWYNSIRKDIPPNCEIILANDATQYVESIVKSKREYDVIVVDGISRVECVEVSIRCLSDEGVVILDDSERGDYFDVMLKLEYQGYKSLTLYGMKPGSHKQEQTTIFYKAKNCLGI